MFTGLAIVLVAIQAASHCDGAQIKTNSSDHIVFPGPIQEVPLNRYGSDHSNEVPEECRHMTYCTVKPADYPQEKFNRLFRDAARRRRNAMSETNDTTNNSSEVSLLESRPLQQTSLVLSDIGDRQGDPEEIDNCETIVTYEPLYKVRTKLGDWLTVVQAPEQNYMQKVRLETCKGSREPCFTIFPPQMSYTTFCKQKYSTWQFVVESKTGSGDYETVKIDLPTCCSCHYKAI